MFLELAKGTALLLALCFCAVQHSRWKVAPIWGSSDSSLLFGGVCLLGILSPLNCCRRGTRSVVLGIQPVCLAAPWSRARQRR